MDPHPNREHWKERLREVGELVRAGLPQFLGFELFFRLLGAVAITPLTAWLAARLIAFSGSGAISNYDLAGFFLSWQGGLYLALIVTIGFTLVFFEFGGLVALAVALSRDKSIRLPRLFRFLFLAFPGMWRLSARQFLVYLALALPCLAVAGGAYQFFLTKSDIYYYIQVKPPEFWIAVALAGLAGAVFAVVALRYFTFWVFSVPLLLLTGVSPAEAMRTSRTLVSGRFMEVFFMLLRWVVFVAVLAAGSALCLTLLRAACLGLAGDRVGLVLSLTAALAVVQFLLGGLVAILAMTALACAVSRRFLALEPAARLPGALSEGDDGVLRVVTRALRTGWAAAVILAALTTYAAFRLANSTRVEETVAVTAHRGSSIAAPENTMAAILLAVEEGADYVEIDVQETSDGTVVLAHDKDLKRVFGIAKGIWEVSYEELRDLDSGGWFSPKFSDQRIATLGQVIDAVNGKAKLNIELKFNGHERRLAEEVVRIVKEKEFGENCILTSLNYAGVRRIAELDPGIRTGVIVTSSIGDITGLQSDLLSVGAKAVDRNLIDRAHRRGLEIHVWTVNDVPSMNSMIGMGVDNIITDDPKLLGEVIEERSRLNNAEKMLLRLADFADRRL